MSNWQQQNQFNIEAPEFVPKFGGGGGSPANNNNQGGQQPRNNNGAPQQQYAQQGAPGGYNQGNPRFYNQQYGHPQQQQQYRQPYYQQQGQYQPQQQYYNNQYPQQGNYQQPPPQHFNNQQLPPQAQQQQVPQQQQQQQQQQAQAGATVSPAKAPAPASPQQPPAGDKSVNQLTTNIAKLSTAETQKPATEPKPAAESKPAAEKPVPPKASVPEEPSVVVEKSVPPQVATIKENEEWDENAEDAEAGDDAVDEKVEGGEAVARPKKKALVIREYKSKKEPVNVIFCGHVDAGKSTIGGQIMFVTGMVDKRTLEKYEREAKEKNRESWYLSWALDTNMEEREKGKTVEVGRAFFETEKKHFIILDAPGHRGFVPNMIGGASQADIAVLVISARRGEFETGFEKGGQTREHAMLVKTAGVKYLIVLVNKMDDPTVNWDEARYKDIVDKLTPYLKKCGFQPGKDTSFMPCSGFTGAFIKDPVDESVCPWYRGPCFIEYLENLPTLNRTSNGPLRMPIVDKYKDMGTVVMGKIESGMIKLNDKFCVMPNKTKVEVSNIYCEEDETDSAICGENVKLKLKGVEEEEISGGFVLCDIKDVCQVAKVFDAQVIILECPSIICPGFNSIMHIHASTCEVQLKVIIGMVDKKTGEKDLKNRPKFIKQDQIAICRFDVLNGAVVCMEPFKLFPQLGRFTLRYENKTVAVGKVLKVIE